MILLETTRACQHCPIALVCLGGQLDTIHREVSLRRCRRCDCVYFTVGLNHYLCRHLSAEEHSIQRFTNGCSPVLRIESYDDIDSCVEYHQADFTARY